MVCDFRKIMQTLEVKTFKLMFSEKEKGFHYRLSKSLRHHHPNIYRFVGLIKQIEKSKSAKMQQSDFGTAPQGRKRVYREKENRLIRLWDQLQTGQKNCVQFLDAVGYLYPTDH